MVRRSCSVLQYRKKKLLYILKFNCYMHFNSSYFTINWIILPLMLFSSLSESYDNRRMSLKFRERVTNR